MGKLFQFENGPKITCTFFRPGRWVKAGIYPEKAAQLDISSCYLRFMATLISYEELPPNCLSSREQKETLSSVGRNVQETWPANI
jgi:hypothetical protein